jgi:hypothetical protein
LDSAYVSLYTNQPEIDSSGNFVSGVSISGTKVVTGAWNFGYATSPVNTPANAPKSYTTNDKYNAGGSTITTKFAALANEDLVTKEVLSDQIDNLLETLEIDNGVYDSATSPTCYNYSVGAGNSDTICPL